MKIYTKTGDRGETSLFSGKRVPKNHILIDALGTVDECNSAIGCALAALPENKATDTLVRQLIIVQHALFDLGASLATPKSGSSQSKLKKTRFDQEEIDLLERWIDEMDAELPKLTTFILPGGHPAGANLHMARSICRRAERIITEISQEEELSESVIVYLNRLSDYLFIASRYLNHKLGSPEVIWEQHMALHLK